MAEGTPYYKPVAPEVPAPDMTVAKIVGATDLAASFTRGFAAFARASAERKQLQVEAEKNITESALKSRQLDILDKNNLLDFQLGNRHMDILDRDSQRDFEVGMKNADRISQLSTDTRKAKAESDANLYDYVTKIQSEIADFQKRKQELGLNDPHPKNVPTFVGNHAQLAFEFQNADIPQIKDELKRTSERVKGMQAQIPVKYYGATRQQDEKGNFTWAGGVERTFTPAEVMAQLGNPDTQEIMANSLEASGLLKTTSTQYTTTGSEKDSKAGEVDSQKVPSTSNTAPDWLLNWYNQGKAMPATPTGTPRPSVGMMAQWMAKRSPTSEDGRQGVMPADVGEAAAVVSTEAAAANNNEVLNPTKNDRLIESYRKHRGEPGFDSEGAKRYLLEQGVPSDQID